MSKRQSLPPHRVQEIADLAEEVAGHLLPVNPISILQSENNISFRRGKFGNAFDGLIEWRDPCFWVYSNLLRVGPPGSARERFTIGHELGHCFIDEHRNALIKGTGRHPSFNEFQSDELAEQEADLFASHLLMPTRVFTAAIPKVPKGIPDILNLKQRFGTSITSTALRYVSLADFFCVVVKWNPDGYGWHWTSQKTYEGRYRRTTKSVNDLPPDSATRMVMMRKTSSSDFIECGAVASMWFNYVDAGGRRDEILIEQAVSLGQYGFLTLLLPESKVGQ